MATSINKISSLIEDQIPSFIREDHPNFTAFLKAYYEWLEDSEKGKVLYQSKKILDYKDIDKTSEEFLNYFKKEFLPNFPEEIVSDKVKLIKHIREFYQKKGTPESLKFLFRVVYGEDIDIFYPKENILKASDGKWQIPRAFKLTTSNTPENIDLNDLLGRRAIGITSQASCVVAGAYRTLDNGTNLEIFEVYVTDVTRPFTNGETLQIVSYDINGNKIVLLSEKILGALSGVTIDPNNRGLGYKTGDPVVFEDGLSKTDPQIAKAVATVNNVTSGKIQSLTLVNGGYGYRLYSNSIVSFVNNPEDTQGTGATARVTNVDTSKAILMDVNIDAIQANKDLTIGATEYLFGYGINTHANKDTALEDAFGYRTLTLYPIKGITLDNRGQNYNFAPTLDVHSYFSTDYSGYKDSLPDPTNSNWIANRQSILDLGIVAHVDVVRGGINYNPSVDEIYIDGLANGYGATFSFTVDGNGTITGVTVVNGGEGYKVADVRIRSANGSGAAFRAYRYGEGAVASINVDKVGQIIDFNLLSRGTGYVSKPNVYLKVADVTLNGNISTVPDAVYQTDGINVTYSAKVDSVLSNNKVRFYNYNGVINESANLFFTTNGVDTINLDFDRANVTIYGNGWAKANAQFLNGLIEYHGYFENTDGFLSSDKRLQDDKKYHNFSYVIVAEKSLHEYRQTLLDIVHPAGTKMLGYNQLLTDIVLFSEQANNSYVYISNNTIYGNVTSNPFNTSRILNGFDTEFQTEATAGDHISINYTTPSAVTVTNRGYGYRANSNTLVNLTNPYSNAYVADIIDGDASGVGVGSSGSTTITINSLTTGEFRIGQILSGTGIEPGTRISKYGTGMGGIGTYIIDTPLSASLTGTITGTCLETLHINTDSIETMMDISLGNTTFEFVNASATLSTTLAEAFAYQNIDVAPINHIRIIDIGSGSTRPFVNVHSYYSTDLSGYVNSKPDISDTNWRDNRQNILDLGIIAHVDVINGGEGYDPLNDTIYIGGTLNGYGATFSFTANETGTIETVKVLTSGEGYVDSNLSINTSTGSNATFKVYRYGEGLVAEVSPIGSRSQTKEIISISSNISMILESNTKVYGDGRLNFIANSNVAYVSGNTYQLNLIQDDNVSFNLESTLVTAKVTYVFGNNITFNLNTLPSANLANVRYEVYPYIDNVDYKIVSTAEINSL